MNHCFYCGAERDGDQCDGCGLPIEAAEVMLRKRLVMRSAFFLVGTALFLPVSLAFPPLELDNILIFVCVLFLVVFGLGLWIVHRARMHQEIEVLRRVYFGLLPVPWILAGLLFFNGRFDGGRAHRQEARVVGKFTMSGTLHPRRLEVTSWRDGRATERLPVSSDDFLRFKIGDSVVVELEDGLMGIPWIAGVYLP